MEEGQGKNRREAYKERFRAKIREIDARIEEFADWARGVETDVRAGILSDDSTLKQKLAQARMRIEELRAASEDGWEEAKAGAQKVCVDVRAAWDRGREAQPDPPATSREPSPDDAPAAQRETESDAARPAT